MAKRFTDRKLGKNWEDWNGMPDGEKGALADGPGTFLVLFGAGLTAITLLLGLDAFIMVRYFVHPYPVFVKVVYLAIGLPLALWWGVYLLTLGALLLEIEAFAIPWLSKWLPMQTPFLTFCGQFARLDRDRVSAACVEATNALARLRLRSASAARPLLLLPRCLDAETLAEIKELAEDRECPVFILDDNGEARGKVFEAQATCAIAVACERDLVGGYYDFARELPVIGVPNRRPLGPCRKATVDLDELREAFEDCGMRGL